MSTFQSYKATAFTFPVERKRGLPDLEVFCLVSVKPREKDPAVMFGGRNPPDIGATPLSLQEEQKQLTPFALWRMVRDVAVEPEEPVPSVRASLGFLPSFRTLIEHNGPLLAAKLSRLLGTQRDAPVDILVVCPRELGALALAKPLEEVLGFDVIGIPREVIDDPLLAESEKFKKDLVEKYADAIWYKQLVSWREGYGDEVLLMDEFVSTGGTLDRMRTVLEHLGLKARTAMTVVNFGTRPVKNLHVHSLYDIQYS